MDERTYVAAGFRFHPTPTVTDEELVEFYLKREKRLISLDKIQQMDIYKCDFWDPIPIGGNDWYFFCQKRGWYYRNCTITQNGFWKATGVDKPIYSSQRSTLIGFKRRLVFYGGHAGGRSSKTDWVMHQFRLTGANDHPKSPNGLETNSFSPKTLQDSWMICKISAQRGISHNSWGRTYEHSSEPMQNHIDWRMLHNSSLHFHPSPDHTSNSNQDRTSNEGATLGAIEEPFHENEIKRVKDVLETRIDIDHPALAAKMRAMIPATDPNLSSADSFYTLITAILAITGQAVFTLISMSNSPTLNCVGAGTVVGFIGAFSAMLLRDRLPNVARHLGKVSVVIGAAAVVVGYAAHFHSDLSWSWGLICGFALLIPSVAVLFA